MVVLFSLFGFPHSIDITKYFLDLDAKAPKADTSALPVRLSGRTGELVTQLYTAGQKNKNFDKLLKELDGFVAAVEAQGTVVDRFFSTSNYSEIECQKVLSLLTSNAEPLSSFASIKDNDVKDILVDNESNLSAWQNARKAVTAVGLSEATKTLLDTMATDGNLARVKKVLAKAHEVRAATSKSLDVTVTSAVALSKTQQESITKALPPYVGGSTVTPTFIVDSAVLGGLLVSFRNQTIDLTSTSRLVEVVAGQK